MPLLRAIVEVVASTRMVTILPKIEAALRETRNLFPHLVSLWKEAEHWQPKQNLARVKTKELPTQVCPLKPPPFSLPIYFPLFAYSQNPFYPDSTHQTPHTALIPLSPAFTHQTPCTAFPYPPPSPTKPLAPPSFPSPPPSPTKPLALPSFPSLPPSPIKPLAPPLLPLSPTFTHQTPRTALLPLSPAFTPRSPLNTKATSCNPRLSSSSTLIEIPLPYHHLIPFASHPNYPPFAIFLYTLKLFPFSIFSDYFQERPDSQRDKQR